jgi:outer membrane lipoprotein SlyB
LEIQTLRPARIKSAVIGAGIGAGTGAALGYLLYKPYLDRKYLNDEWSTVGAITRGMVWGGAVGGVLGYLLGGDRREHVPFGATAEVQPVPSGVAVGLRLPLSK